MKDSTGESYEPWPGNWGGLSLAGCVGLGLACSTLRLGSLLCKGKGLGYMFFKVHLRVNTLPFLLTRVFRAESPKQASLTKICLTAQRSPSIFPQGLQHKDYV